MTPTAAGSVVPEPIEHTAKVGISVNEYVHENPWPIIANFHEALIRIGNEHKAEKYAEEFPDLIDTKSVSNLSSDEFDKVIKPILEHQRFIRNFELELMKNTSKVPRELSEKPWTKEKLDRIKAINKIELDAYNKLQEQRREQLRQERESEAIRKKQREKLKFCAEHSLRN